MQPQSLHVKVMGLSPHNTSGFPYYSHRHTAMVKWVPMLAAKPDATTTATLARLFRVLGDPTRLAIVELLEEGEMPVRDLVAAVGSSQPRVSTHLACLRHCGLVETERRGREVLYRLSIPGLPALLRTAAAIAAPRAEHLATCHRVGPDWV
jgi:DNA-binding transcriptional ArsR family regulator